MLETSLPSPEADRSEDTPRAGLAARTHIGDQTVLLGDCLTRLEGMRPESVDVVVTSPPYNIGVSYNAYDDRGGRPDYVQFMKAVADQLIRILRPDGSFFLNVSGTSADPWVPFDLMAALRERWTLQNHIVWAKSVSIGDVTHGHFKPINSKRFLNHTHEQVFHLTKTGTVPLDRLAVGVPFSDKSNISRWGHAKDRRCAGNVWHIPYETIRSKNQRYHHPASFPVGLPERCIRLHGRANADVLDPFLGVGSTLVAARNLNCRGVGIEIDATYAAAAIDRLKHGTG